VPPVGHRLLQVDILRLIMLSCLLPCRDRLRRPPLHLRVLPSTLVEVWKLRISAAGELEQERAPRVLGHHRLVTVIAGENSSCAIVGHVQRASTPPAFRSSA